MKPDRLESLPDLGVAFDTETHRIQPGLLAPPLVCGSIALDTGGHLLDQDTCRAVFAELLADDSKTIIGANVAYDMLVMAVDAARRGIDLMPQIFAAYEAGRVYDILIAEALHGVAMGTLGRDLRDPDTGRPTSRYSLAVCVDVVLGRSTAKVNDRFRESYALLEHVPIDQWPLEARAYPVDDAVNTRDVALAQLRRNRNLHDLADQAYAAWAMHLGAAWGFRVDPAAIDALEESVKTNRAAALQQFIDAGFFKFTRGGALEVSNKTGAESRNQATIKRLVALAYGAHGKCNPCDGTGRVPGETKCKECELHLLGTCPACNGVGRVPNPRTSKGCPDCDSTGLLLDTAPVPRTEKGAVQIGRDALSESGDELLIDFAGFLEDQKIASTYIPWLRKGINAKGYPIPLTLRPNVLLETGRASYGDVVQQLPRSGGVRECIVARPGFVLCSCDFTGLELVTHAQSCLWLVGWSKLADALNGGMDAHSSFAAGMLGIKYSEFDKKDADHKAYRQAAKAANFGFPGGMGPAKLALAQRKGGPDTTGPDGRVYKGLRFCLLIGGETRCGVEKVTEWRDRPLPPTCKRCIECADDLRRWWFDQWPENSTYFEHVSQVVDNDGEVIQHVSGRVRGGVNFTSAANGWFQGLGADGAKNALRIVTREQYVNRQSPLFGSRTILFAHDELVVEVPEARAHEAAAELSRVMIDAMKKYTPNVKIGAEPALMRRWYKGAEPTYRDGKLIPWEPE